MNQSEKIKNLKYYKCYVHNCVVHSMDDITCKLSFLANIKPNCCIKEFKYFPMTDFSRNSK